MWREEREWDRTCKMGEKVLRQQELIQRSHEIDANRRCILHWQWIREIKTKYSKKTTRNSKAPRLVHNPCALRNSESKKKGTCYKNEEKMKGITRNGSNLMMQSFGILCREPPWLFCAFCYFPPLFIHVRKQGKKRVGQKKREVRRSWSLSPSFSCVSLSI